MARKCKYCICLDVSRMPKFMTGYGWCNYWSKAYKTENIKSCFRPKCNNCTDLTQACTKRGGEANGETS